MKIINEIIKLIKYLNLLERHRAFRVLLAIFYRINNEPSSIRNRKVQDTTYKFITKYLGPIEKYCVYHKAYDNSNESYKDYWVIVNLTINVLKKDYYYNLFYIIASILLIIIGACYAIFINT